MTLRRKNLLPHSPLVYTYGLMLVYGMLNPQAPAARAHSCHQVALVFDKDAEAYHIPAPRGTGHVGRRVLVFGLDGVGGRRAQVVPEGEVAALEVLLDRLLDVSRRLEDGREDCARLRIRLDGRELAVERLRSEVNSELNFPPKLRGARSRLYRRRFLQVNTRWN